MASGGNGLDKGKFGLENKFEEDEVKNDSRVLLLRNNMITETEIH